MDQEFLDALNHDTEALRGVGLYKDERIIASPQAADITLADGARVINFCANNYLGLSNHPALIAAAKAARWRPGLRPRRRRAGPQVRP